MQDDKIYIVTENPMYYKKNGVIHNRDEKAYYQALNRRNKEIEHTKLLQKVSEIDTLTARVQQIEEILEKRFDALELLLQKLTNIGNV